MQRPGSPTSSSVPQPADDGQETQTPLLTLRDGLPPGSGKPSPKVAAAFARW